MALDLGPKVSNILGGASSTIITGQDRTNLGPLTTTFTQPPSCTIAVAGHDDNGLAGFLARTCALSQGSDMGSDDASCWPSTSSGATTPSAPFQGWGFYSPGTICPTGYSSACSATGGTSSSSGWPVQFQLLDGETAVGCCPSGYMCGNAGGQTCIQTATSATFATASCELGKMVDSGTVVMPATSATITAATLFAPMFQINWQSSDQAAVPATPKISLSSSQPTETGSRSPSRTRFPSLVGTQTVSTDGSQSGGLVMASTSNVDTTESTIPTTAVASSSAASNGTDSGSLDNNDANTSNKGRSGFPVAAMVSVSVAGGLGALAVLIWAVYMWQRRKQWNKEMLQGINDDRMLQLDSIYEEARPKTFDTAGRETIYAGGLGRQDTLGNRLDPDLMYGPGQETSRILRAGPRRSPQLVGFPEAISGDTGTPTGPTNLPNDAGYGPYYRQ
ncbi:hypothetical protein VP1G_00007 [Cytospora mali]|uniref:Uncharacterized protein n=1 Tax=Cytospora mali TaxID=578113 RepID=A0A194UMI2_CYTMA|nr:hypothetical protein VP1G_00007 [Valsa mali var. pyri (nom. inval.)]